MAFIDQELGRWAPGLAQARQEPWYLSLMERVEAAYAKGDPRVFPPRDELFTALRLTAPEEVKCVILGQDPYHQEGQAQGLSFSVHRGIQIPPSLRNIYREWEEDLGAAAPDHGSLEAWARHGVLLLNDVLTVYEGQANSHKGWGWEQFTSRLLGIVERQPRPVAYVLWGRSAQKKAEQGRLGRCSYPRLILRSTHPSPLSAHRGFFGSRPFSQVDAFLMENGAEPIDWSLD